MPTATPFVALGRGNGLPFCLNAADVSGTDWCRNLSLTQAMSAWWLPYSVQVQVSWRSAWTDSSVSPPVFRDTTQSLDLTAEYGSALTVPLEPRERVCLDSGDLSATTSSAPSTTVVFAPAAFAQASGSYAVQISLALDDFDETYPEQFLVLSTISDDPGFTDSIDVSTPYGDVRLYGYAPQGTGVEFELLSASIDITDWTF